LGTLVALIIFFFTDILKYLSGFLRSFVRWNIKTDSDQRLAWYLFIATIPALAAGYFFDDIIESVFRNVSLVAWVFIGFGLILYLADKYLLTNKSIVQLTFGNSLVIGLAQVLALIPGVSRSGITIIAGLSQKLKREQAARFSFLLSIPAVFAAGTKKTLDLYQSQMIGSADFIVLLIGFLTSAIIGYLCIKYFLKFLQNHSLKIFAYYRVVLGLIVLVILYIMR
jgi:undecaprenyl-diphosphatase